MQTITCDICKKKVDNSITGRTFFYVGPHSMCEPCKDNLEYSVKPNVRAKEPFSYEWYFKLLSDSLGKAVQKGRI
jgi:hypothetical protein